jgi:hypothetical protein
MRMSEAQIAREVHEDMLRDRCVEQDRLQAL